MFKFRLLLIPLILILVACAGLGPRRDPSLRPVPTLPPGWSKIEPGGETRCAHDTPYAFWARPGESGRLLIYFQGGGGCWDAATCAPGSTFYDDRVEDGDSPELRSGLFEFDNQENPFAGDSMVYIPSCTGDVHWGDNVQIYPNLLGEDQVIYHRGFVNAQAALQWAYRQFPVPEAVFATGCSAGSVGSAAHVPYIIEQYPGIPVTQLGDSLAFVFHRPLDLSDYGTYATLAPWIPGLNELAPEGFTMARYYQAVAGHYPGNIFAQFNYAGDQVQDRYYLAIGGAPGDFPAALRESLDEIREGTTNFHTYTAPGFSHCILPTARLYREVVDGVRFRDWLADLAMGREVRTVP